MKEDVKVCVDSRINFFYEYFDIPESLKFEIEVLFDDVNILAEKCKTVNDFEERFISDGLSVRFNDCLSKCTPKQKTITKAEKKSSVRIAKEIILNDKENIAKDVLKDVTNRMFNDTKDEMITESRERMIEEGTLADHTIKKNFIRSVGSLLKRKHKL